MNLGRIMGELIVTLTGLGVDLGEECDCGVYDR